MVEEADLNSESVSQWGKAALKLLGVSNKSELESEETDDSALPFGLRTQMMAEDKAILYRALVAALAADAVVFSKVRLADFLFVVGGGDDLKHAIKMDRKYVDFLLCDPFSMQPIAVVELTYPVNESEKTPVRDPFVTRALKTAGISLLKIQACPSYPVQELRRLILAKIQKQLESTRTGRSVDTAGKQFETTINDLPEHTTSCDLESDHEANATDQNS